MAGRPTKFEEEHCERIIDLMSQGYSIEACAGALGVHKDTIYEWIKVHPEFSDAKRIGESASRYFWEKLGITHVLNVSSGNKFENESTSLNSTVWIFNMKNRFGWRDKIEVSGDDDRPIAVAYVPKSKRRPE
jgi:hypothetical protein